MLIAYIYIYIYIAYTYIHYNYISVVQLMKTHGSKCPDLLYDIYVVWIAQKNFFVHVWCNNDPLQYYIICVRTCGVNNSDPIYIYIYTQMLIAYLHIMYANCRYIHTIGVLHTFNSIQLHSINIHTYWKATITATDCMYCIGSSPDATAMYGRNNQPCLSTGETIAPLGCGRTHVQCNIPSHKWWQLYIATQIKWPCTCKLWLTTHCLCLLKTPAPMT